jgi:hypothetical protein
MRQPFGTRSSTGGPLESSALAATALTFALELATVVFLDIHGSATTLTEDGAFDLVMDVVAGRAAVEEIAERLSLETPR